MHPIQEGRKVTLALENITPEVVASMSPDAKRELLVLLEALDRPRLLRTQREQGPPLDLGDALEAAWKRQESLTPEQLAAEDAERERDEDELLEWAVGRGKRVKLEPYHENIVRMARMRRAERENPDGMDEVKAVWRELRKENPDAGGDGVSLLLGEPVKAKPGQQYLSVPEQPAQPVKLPENVIQTRRRGRVLERRGEAFVSVYDGLTLEAINEAEKRFRESNPPMERMNWGR